MLQSVADMNIGHRCFPIHPGQMLDIGSRNARYLGYCFRRVFLRLLSQLFMSGCVSVQEAIVRQPVAEQNMHNAKGKCRIRSGI
ncbi:hypothetical protein D3C72_2250300 [compost metagenome]